jgi:prepilin-type N-terminal cleavage/methylation domain-containing protein
MSAKMAYMSPIKDRKQFIPNEKGFTLVEVMMVTVISSFVFAGVLSAYIFLGRGLVRQGNAESLESRTRTTLFYFTQDVSATSAISISLSTELKLTTASGTIVDYVYSPAVDSQGNPAGTLTRVPSPPNANIPVTLLIGLSSFQFNYMDMSGNVMNPANNTPLVKQVSIDYTAFAGAAVSGAQSHFSVVSPWVIAKNKPNLL